MMGFQGQFRFAVCSVGRVWVPQCCFQGREDVLGVGTEQEMMTLMDKRWVLSELIIG